MPINKRLLREMERGSLDATWMPYARDLEYDVVPVKVRLLKNLSDYRVFLVRSGETGRFAGVKSLEDLRKFKGGIGSHWADRRVIMRWRYPALKWQDRRGYSSHGSNPLPRR